MDYKITGQDELLKCMANLPHSTQTKVLRYAGRAGAKIIAAAAAENVRAITSEHATGLLAKNIKVYSLRSVNGMIRFGVMVKSHLNTSKGVRVGLYASVLEYGKNNQPPRSWLRKAAREKQGEALAATNEEVRKRINAAIDDAKQ